MSATPAPPGARRSEPQSLSPLSEARYHAAPQRALFAFPVQALVLQAQGPQAARLVCLPGNGPVAAMEPAQLQPAAVPASAPFTFLCGAAFDPEAGLLAVVESSPESAPRLHLLETAHERWLPPRPLPARGPLRAFDVSQGWLILVSTTGEVSCQAARPGAPPPAPLVAPVLVGWAEDGAGRWLLGALPGAAPGDPPRPQRWSLPAAPGAVQTEPRVHPVAVRRRDQRTEVLVGLGGGGPLEQWGLDHHDPSAPRFDDELHCAVPCTAACAFGDDEWLLGDEGGAVSRWQFGCPGTLPCSIGRGSAVTALACQPSGPLAGIWIGYDDGVVGRPLRPKQAGQEPTIVHRLHPGPGCGSSFLVEGPRAQEVWDFACDEPLAQPASPAPASPRRRACSPDGSLLVEWDAQTLRLPDRALPLRGVRHAAVSNDRVVVIALNGRIERRSLDQPEQVVESIELPSDRPYRGPIHVAVSARARGRRAVVTVCAIQGFFVWRIGREVPILDYYPYEVGGGGEAVRVGASAIVHDPFGRRFLIAINDHHQRRWLRIYGLRDGSLKQERRGVLAEPGLVVQTDPSYAYRVRIAVADENRQLCRLLFDTRSPRYFRPAMEPEPKILFVRLSTRGQAPLAQAKEHQLIAAALKKTGSPFQVVGAEVELGAGRFGSRLVSLLQEHKPWALHISGHCDEAGLLLGLTESVDAELRGGITAPDAEAARPGALVEPLPLLELLARADALRSLRLVILNVCNGRQVARLLADNIPFAIGTAGALADSAACSYAEGFYLTFGSQRDVVRAHEAALAILKLDRGGAPFHLFQNQ